MDLGTWKLVCFVENCLETEDREWQGQTQSFTAILTSPDKRLCLVRFNAYPFEDQLQFASDWKVLGEIRSLSEESIETDTIVLAKLIEKGREYSVIVQYDGWLVALKVMREISGNALLHRIGLMENLSHFHQSQVHQG